MDSGRSLLYPSSVDEEAYTEDNGVTSDSLDDPLTDEELSSKILSYYFHGCAGFWGRVEHCRHLCARLVFAMSWGYV